MRKTIIAVVAISVAAAFTPALAAGPVGPGSKIETEAAVQAVKMKKKWTFFKKKPMMKMKYGKRAKSKRAGTCGAYMYYSRKGGKCMDARKK